MTSQLLTARRYSVRSDTHLFVTHAIIREGNIIGSIGLDFPFNNWPYDYNTLYGICRDLFSSIVKCPVLKALTLGGPGLVFCPIPQMQVICGQIESLMLRELELPLSEDLSRIFQVEFRNLQTLELKYSTCITDEVMNAILENCVNLKFLNVDHCIPLTEQAFANLHNCQYLRFIHVNGCSNVEGQRLLGHIGKCKSLLSFNVYNTLGNTAAAAEKCVTELPLVKLLLVHYIDPSPTDMQENSIFSQYINVAGSS